MFKGCASLTLLDLRTNNPLLCPDALIENIGTMFKDCTSLNKNGPLLVVLDALP